MNPKKLGILAAVAVVLGGIAYMTSREPAGNTPDAMGKPVLEDLDVNAVQAITLTTASATTTVTRVGDKWVLANRYNYPVDFAKVRDAVIDLSELKVGQVIKVSDTRRKALKLAPPKPGDEETGMLVELSGDGTDKLATLLVGETRERKSEDGQQGGYPDGRYVSTDDGKTAYLVKETLSQLSTTATDWLDTEICNVSSSDIEDIQITGPARPKLVFSKKDGSLKLEGVRDEEELETSKMYSIESALSYLRLADIADPGLTDDVTGMDKPVVFTATTKKGEIYTATVGGKVAGGDKSYVRLAVALKPEAPEPKKAEEGEEKSEEDKKKEEEEAEKKAKERKELEDKVAELSAKLSPWTFVIESYKTDNLAITRDKLVKLKEKEDEEKKDEDKAPVVEGTPGKVETVQPAPKPVAPPTVVTEPVAVPKVEAKPVKPKTPPTPKPDVKPVPKVEVKPAPKPVPPPTVVTEPVAVPKVEAKPAAKVKIIEPVAKPVPKAVTPPTVVTEPVAVPKVEVKPAPAPKAVEAPKPTPAPKPAVLPPAPKPAPKPAAPEKATGQ